MSTDDRKTPPGQGRISAAASRGLFAYSDTFVAGLALVLCAFVFATMDTVIESKIESLLNLNSLLSRPSATSALKSALVLAGVLLAPVLGAAVIAGITGSWIPFFIARRGQKRTAVPLPQRQPQNFSSGIVRIAGACLLLLVFAQVIRGQREVLVRLSTGELRVASELIGGVSRLLAAGGAVLILTGAAELALKRQKIWHQLHLTDREARRERRAADGDRRVMSESRKRGQLEVPK